MERNNQQLQELEKRIGIKFKDEKLLKQVFIHRSFLNENVGTDLDHNERLEFLGDAVLELIVTDHLFKNYPNPEGELTNWRSALVKGAMLSKVATNLKIGELLYLSKGEEKTGGKSRSLILANTFEALIGAIYLDLGFEATKKFIDKYLIVNLPTILEDQSYIDPKSKLQELSQAKENITPIYKVLKEFGPDHNKSFTVGVSMGENLIGQGSGSSKQKAEQAAASDALAHMSEWFNPKVS